jgi:sRNA-binding regulator protein Hfq
MKNLEQKIISLRKTGNFFKRASILLTGAILGYSSDVSAEVIYLTNGKQIEGKIISQDETTLKVKTDFGEVLILNENIKTVEYSPANSPLQTPPKEETKPLEKPMHKMKHQPVESKEEPEKEPENKNYESSGFGFNIGAFFSSDERFDKIYGTGIMGGFDYVSAISPWFSTGFDLNGYYSSGEPEIYTFGNIDKENVKAKAKMIIFMLGVEGRLTLSGEDTPLIPYLGFGADFWYFKETLDFMGDSKSGSTEGMGAHIGLGLEYVVTEHLILNIKVRDTYVPMERLSSFESGELSKEKTNLGGVGVMMGIRAKK